MVTHHEASLDIGAGDPHAPVMHSEAPWSTTPCGTLGLPLPETVHTVVRA
jgi:hypothetical protein